MTEHEWLTSNDPILLMRGAGEWVTDRQKVLFEFACAESVSSHWPDPVCSEYARVVLDALDGFGPSPDERAELIGQLGERLDDAMGVVDLHGREVFSARGASDQEVMDAAIAYVSANLVNFLDAAVPWCDSMRGRYVATPRPASFPDLLEFVQREVYRRNLPLLRCIVPNPFRPVALDRAWLTPTVTTLAGGIYDDRAFDRLPILADALQDAGCEDTDVLGHCRGPGPHARGCWVVDAILGKS